LFSGHHSFPKKQPDRQVCRVQCRVECRSNKTERERERDAAASAAKEMAVVKRKKHHTPRTPLAKLLRAFLAVLACLFAAVLLFQLDAFSKKHKHHGKNKSIPRVSYMNPELVAQQQQQLRGAGLQQQEAAPPQPNPAAVQDLKIIQNAGDEEKKVQQSQRKKSHSENTRRRVEFTLSNLKDDIDEIASLVVETNADWAPRGVAHFWDLIEADFYKDCRFFRVVPKFVAQFGIAADPAVTAKYHSDTIQDDPVVESNQRGTLTYAMSGPNTRSTQLFFNFKDNHYLDREGFAPIGRIVEGLDALEKINDRHRELPKQGQIVQHGNAYLEEEFADLTYISAVRILDDYNNDNSKKQEEDDDDDGEGGDDDDNDESSPEQVG